MQEVDLHFPSSHIRNGKTCRSISSLPAPPHIWYLMQTFWRLIPFPFVLWQSLTPWTVTAPSPCAICVEMTILAQQSLVSEWRTDYQGGGVESLWEHLSTQRSNNEERIGAGLSEGLLVKLWQRLLLSTTWISVFLDLYFCIFEKWFGCGGGGGGTVGAKTLTHTPPWETAQIKQLRSDLPANMIWSRWEIHFVNLDKYRWHSHT